VEATAPTAPVVRTGGAVLLELSATNTGNTPIANLQVTSSVGAPVTCNKTHLAPTEVAQCLAQTSALEGNQSVSLQATGNAGVGPLLSASAAGAYFGASPGLAVEALIENLEADVAPGLLAPAGSALQLTARISNTGNITLTGVSATGTTVGPFNCPQATLAPGAFMLCPLAWTLAAGQLAETVVAGGSPPAGITAVAAADPLFAFGAAPAIRILTSVEGSPADEAPGTFRSAGSSVTWGYQIINEGNIRLNNIAVTDSLGAPVACPSPWLEAGASFSCSSSTLLDVGQQLWTGRVVAQASVGAPVQDDDVAWAFGATLSLGFEAEARALSGTEIRTFDADLSPGPLFYTGQPIEWRYSLTNTSNVPLTNLSAGNSLGLLFGCGKTTLLVGEATLCTATSPVLSGSRAQPGSASATPPVGLPAILVQDPLFYTGRTLSPALALELLVNGQPAPDAPGPLLEAGADFSYSYVVTNTGNITLTGVAVTPGQGVVPICGAVDLAAGASTTCVATQPAAAGILANSAQVTAFDPVGTQVSAGGTGYAFGVTSGISFERRVNGLPALAPGPFVATGAPLAWEYRVTNTGNYPASVLVEESDPSLRVICPAGGSGGIVAPGITLVCGANDSADSGAFASQARATLTPAVGPPVVSTQSGGYFGVVTGLVLDKQQNGEQAASPPGPDVVAGDPLNLHYVVTNTSNVTLSNLLILEGQSGPAPVCASLQLLPGVSTTCSAARVALEGTQAPSAVAQGNTPLGPLSSASDVTHYQGYILNPAISLTVALDGAQQSSAPGLLVDEGATVALSYTVRNTGNAQLAAISVTSSRAGAVACPQTTLAPGADMRCTVSTVARAGAQVDEVIVTALPERALPAVHASAQGHFFGVSSGLAVEAEIDGAQADSPPGVAVQAGAHVTVTYRLTNTGNFAALVTLTSQAGLGLTCPSLQSVAAGAHLICTASTVAPTGSFMEVGRATLLSATGAVLQAEDPVHLFGVDAALVVVPFAAGAAADVAPGPRLPAGLPLLWSYRVNNTGNSTLTDLTVNHNGVAADCPVTAIAPGQVVECSARRTQPAGESMEPVVASASALAGARTLAYVNAFSFGQQTQLALEKRFAGSDADEPPGPQVRARTNVDVSWALTNTGNVTLSVWLADNSAAVPATCATVTLAPGASQQCGGSLVAPVGALSTVVTATARPSLRPLIGAEEVVTVMDEAHLFGRAPLVALTGTVAGRVNPTAPGPEVEAGLPLPRTWRIENRGNVPLSSILLFESGTPISCALPVLQPGDGATCIVTTPARTGTVSILGSVLAVPPLDAPVEATRRVAYTGIVRSAALAFSTGTDGRADDLPPGPLVLAGAPLTRTYTISNTGNVSLTAPTVFDSLFGAVTCGSGELAAGAVRRCTAQVQAPRGDVTSTITVSAVPLGGGETVAATRTAYFFGAAAGYALTIAYQTPPAEAQGIHATDPVAGQMLTVTVTARNTGNVSLTGPLVSSSPRADWSCAATTLLPGETLDCQARVEALEGSQQVEVTVSFEAAGQPLPAQTVILRYEGRPVQQDFRVLLPIGRR
jgi:hypothetical protein